MKKFSKKNIKKNLHSSRFNKKTKNIIKTKKLKRKINNMKGGRINLRIQYVLGSHLRIYAREKIIIPDDFEYIFKEIHSQYKFYFGDKNPLLEVQGKMNYNNSTAWAIPTLNVIKYIKEIAGDDSILEIGAGYGLWAALLTMIGCKIIPTDDYSWMKTKTGEDEETYINVENISYGNALEKYKECKILFLCWPHAANDMPYNTIKKFTEENNGQILIYIGEDEGGRTGSPEFFEYLDEHWLNEKEEYENIVKFFQPSSKLNNMSNKAKTNIAIEALKMPNWSDEYSHIKIFRRKSKIQNI
jgi:hypothetical protein